ncbi:MAG: hypothetical protein ABL989_10335 [Gammaproteobacteria bacterium]
MDWLVAALALFVGCLLLALFAATIWSCVSLLWDAWRESGDDRA